MADDEDFVYDDTPENAPVIARSSRSISAKEARELRESPIFKNMKEKFRETCAREKRPCGICSNEIDYRLKYPHPWALSVDHIVTVKENPALLMDTNNLQATHYDCNIGRGTDELSIDIGKCSEIW